MQSRADRAGTRPTMIQIVPALPPVPNGVGDYGLDLACAMRREFGVQTLFVVDDDGRDHVEEVEGFGASRLGTRSAQALAEALYAAANHSAGDSNVLLQLSPYGYSSRGCPFWLLEGLRRWRRKRPDGRLLTMFHELFAGAPPWRKAFWFRPAQKFVVREIARLSDVAVTTNQLYRKLLEELDPSKLRKVQVLPASSTVGEPVAPAQLIARGKGLVVFGLPASRKKAYDVHRTVLKRACEQLGIEEIHDVGPPFESVPETIDSIPVRKHGHMPAAELSRLLSESMAGYVSYSSGFMAKSSVLAAYCAHRMVPLTAEEGCSEADGLRCGVHYYNAAGRAGLYASSPQPQAIADAAWHWYQGHALTNHAAMFSLAEGSAGHSVAGRLQAGTAGRR